jgi:hypothetical protein
MAKESINKKLELIMNYDVNDASIKDSSNKRKSFVMRYWFDQVTYMNIKQERFRYLPNDSSLKFECEQILKTQILDSRTVRFEESLVYVLLVSKDS